MAFKASTPPSNSYQCEHCGAKLPPPTSEGTQTCRFCQAHYQVKTEASSPQGFTIVFGGGSTQFGNNPASFGSYPAPSSQAMESIVNAGVKTAKWSLIMGLVITIVVIASVAIPLWFVFKDGFDFASNTGSTTNLSIPGGGGVDFTFAEDGAVILPGEPTAPAQVLQIASHYDQKAQASVRTMLKLDLGTKQVAWTSKPFEEPSFGRTIVTDGVNAYVPDKAQIRAIKLADGTDAWQGPLSDKVSTSCQDCVYLVGDKLIVRTDDGQVQALDTATGASSWNRKVSDVRARPFPSGDKVLVLDGEKGTYSLIIVNAADGAELGVITPSCTPGRMGTGLRADSQVIPAPLENAVYIGMGSSTACWQKYDLANPGAPVINAPVEGGYLDSTDATPAVGEGHIIWGQRSVGGAIGDFDLAAGTARLLDEGAEVDYAAVAVTGGKAIVRAKTTLGTSKLSVRAFDLASGTQVWEKALGEADSLDPPKAAPSNTLSDGKSLVSVSVAPDGQIQVLTVSATAKDVTAKAESVDASTGVGTGAAAPVSLGKEIGIASANLIGWNGSRVTFLASNKILTLDAATGTQVASIP